jgi:protein-arginine kinase activator protein McsA
MRITRKTNIFVETVRKVVRQQPTAELIFCEQCAEKMISAQMSADYFGFSSRIIYRLIESEKIYFIETETNEIYVCPICVQQALKSIL